MPPDPRPDAAAVVKTRRKLARLLATAAIRAAVAQQKQQPGEGGEESERSGQEPGIT